MGNFCCSDGEDVNNVLTQSVNLCRPIINDSNDEINDLLEVDEKSDSMSISNNTYRKASEDSSSSNSVSSEEQQQPSKPYVILITGPDLEEVINETNTVSRSPKANKPDIIDTTLGGIIQWKKVADFSALLPRDVKLKLWKGVFKNSENTNIDNKKIKNIEMKQLSKILRTFVMLQLTRQYKKNGNTVPIDIKKELPFAVKEPSKFIANFLKNDENVIRQSLITIYETLCNQCHSHSSSTTDIKKKEKYVKKLQSIQNNFQQLTTSPLQNEFNKEDFLKNVFLQYMLYAYQIKLDSSIKYKKK